MNVCKKICNECPFSNKSLNGWLADYTIEDFISFQRSDVAFPCHMMTDNNISINEVEESIKSGELKLCRGYVESMIKSCKLPINPLLKEAIEEVKKEGLSQNSMAIWEFKRHHEMLK